MEKRLLPLKVPFKKEQQQLLLNQNRGSKVARNLPPKQPKSKMNQEVPTNQENIDFMGKVTPQTVSLQILSAFFI